MELVRRPPTPHAPNARRHTRSSCVRDRSAITCEARQKLDARSTAQLTRHERCETHIRRLGGRPCGENELEDTMSINVHGRSMSILCACALAVGCSSGVFPGDPNAGDDGGGVYEGPQQLPSACSRASDEIRVTKSGDATSFAIVW